jgi:hypothetical protein
MEELGMKQQMVAAADDAANHTALLKLLQHKGIIQAEDFDFYWTQRTCALAHHIAMTMGLVVAAQTANGEMDEDDAEEMAIELGFESRFDLREKAIAAVDFIYLPEDHRTKVLEALGV